MAKKKEEKKGNPTEAAIADADKAADAAIVAAVTAKEGEEAPKGEPKVKLPKYKVTEDWHGSIGGSITTIAKAELLSYAEKGPVCRNLINITWSELPNESICASGVVDFPGAIMIANNMASASMIALLISYRP